MIGIINKKSLLLVSLFLVLGLFFVQKTYAISNATDTISTSRPSAAAPLINDQSAADTSVKVVDNGSMFLASDSAVIYPDTGETINANLNIASMSAQFSGTPLSRFVYVTNSGGISNKHHKGDVLIVNVPATHMFEFTPGTPIPNTGQIKLVFPTVANNTASPSATGFSFNGLPTANVICNPTNACSGGVSVNGNTITLTTGAVISSTVYVAVGCTGTITITGGQGTCSTSKPTLINPVKSSGFICSNLGTGTPCQADQWKVTIQTTDTAANGSTVLESAKVVAATIEAVTVQGTVEPYITFTITGIANGTTVCSDPATNPGVGNDATPFFVNLGGLSNGINISAQNLIVSTNGLSGYDITATSSGHFINNSTGFWFPDANGGNGLTNIDTPNPGSITAGTTAFGIHPCSAGSTSIPTVAGIWGSGTTAGGGAKYSNPYNTGVNNYFANISSFASAASNSTTTIEYAATAALTVPAGIYTTVFTYVATPSF